MAKSCLNLNRLSVLLLISIFCAVWSAPTSSEVDLVQGNSPIEENSADEEQKGYGDDQPQEENSADEEQNGYGEDQPQEENSANEEQKLYDDDQPIYEFQLAVWPNEYLGSAQHTPYPGANNVYAPQFEDQEVVYPDLIDSEDGDDQVNPTIPTWQNPQTVTKPPAPAQNDIMAAIFPDIQFDEAEAIADHNDEDVDQGPIVGGQVGVVTQRPNPHVEVIEQYQMVHPNGTTEYKLVLSNGMTNYKKIYNKLMQNGTLVTVQEGYDSVPIPGNDPYSNEFQTQFYIADEHGHNVYKVEKHTRRPKLPQYLDYKLQLGKF